MFVSCLILYHLEVGFTLLDIHCKGFLTRGAQIVDEKQEAHSLLWSLHIFNKDNVSIPMDRQLSNMIV